MKKGRIREIIWNIQLLCVELEPFSMSCEMATPVRHAQQSTKAQQATDGKDPRQGEHWTPEMAHLKANFSLSSAELLSGSSRMSLCHLTYLITTHAHKGLEYEVREAI